MKAPGQRLECVALRWRALAERRRDHFYELYQSGRWRRYYDDQSFLDAMRSAVEIAERWALIAPRPEELNAASEAVPASDAAAHDGAELPSAA